MSSSHALGSPSTFQVGNGVVLARVAQHGTATPPTPNPLVTVQASGTGLRAEDGPVLPDTLQLSGLCVKLLHTGGCQ